jgi:hypothetical protein
MDAYRRPTDASLKIEIAVIGDLEAPFEPGPIDRRFYKEAYARRRRVRLEAEQNETLASVLERAAGLMGLQPPPGHWSGPRFDASHRRVAFYKPGDEHEFQPRAQARLLMGELTLVDEAGRAIFGVHDLRAVRYRDLLRAADAGTLEGDPLRPYLVLDEGWGDAPPADWSTVQQGLEVAWEVLKAVGVLSGAAGGAMAAWKWLGQRLGAARESVVANPEWAQRGYRPDQFAALVLTRDWTTSELAERFGCSKNDAEAILWLIGFSFDEDAGRWSAPRDGTDASTMLTMNLLQAISWAAHSGGDWEVRFRRWLLRYLETGRPPALETLDPVTESEDPRVWKPTAGERLDRIIARLRDLFRGRTRREP